MYILFFLFIPLRSLTDIHLTYCFWGAGWFGPDGFPVGPYKHDEENVKDDQIADCWQKETVWLTVILTSLTWIFDMNN